MRKFLMMATLFGCLCSGIGHAHVPDTVFISTTQTVHLRFASELKYVNLGNMAIVARIVDGSKDFVAVKAREPFDICTSMSCLEASGDMHTFLVAYREVPPQLEVDTRPGADFSFSRPSADGVPSAPISFDKISEMKQELYHIGTKGYGIDILCENIFYKDDVLFLLISLSNASAVSYDLSAPRFAVESKRRTRRSLQYEKAVFPKQSYSLGVVAPGSEARLVFTFDKVSLTRGQVFRVYFYEKGGARNFILTFSARDINYAKKL